MDGGHTPDEGGGGALTTPPHEPPDRDLVARFVAQRDEAAFRALYRRHTPRLFALLIRLGGGRDADLEDTVQETWVRAAEALAGFRWDSALSTWLAGIAINRRRERRRSQARTSRREEVFAAQAGGAAGGERGGEAQSAGDPAGVIDLRGAVARLPDGFREVLVLHDVFGHTHEEIGRMLGIEPGTSKSQLARARQAARRLLGAAEGGRR
jgi:RNA polymerase sigma-70 factor (ECF subfamily)